jgi:hypothetical protein
MLNHFSIQQKVLINGSGFEKETIVTERTRIHNTGFKLTRGREVKKSPYFTAYFRARSPKMRTIISLHTYSHPRSFSFDFQKLFESVARSCMVASQPRQDAADQVLPD